MKYFLVVFCILCSGCLGPYPWYHMYRGGYAQHYRYQPYMMQRSYFTPRRVRPNATQCDSDPTCIRLVNRSRSGGFARCWIGHVLVAGPNTIPLIYRQGMREVVKPTNTIPPGWETRLYVEPGESYKLSCHLYKRVVGSPLSAPFRRVYESQVDIYPSRFGERMIRVGEEFMAPAKSKYAN